MDEKYYPANLNGMFMTVIRILARTIVAASQSAPGSMPIGGSR